jgi:peptide/nickel transport system permease protein
MLKYTLRRLLIFIPMLIAISLLAFIISINAPGDPVDRLTKAAGNEGGADQQSGTAKKDKEAKRKQLGLDLPIFYFSIGDIASSDTLYKVQDRDHRENLEVLTHQFGNWIAVSNYYHALLSFQKSLQKINIDIIHQQDSSIDKVKSHDLLINLKNNIAGLLTLSKVRLVNSRIENIDEIINNNYIFNAISQEFKLIKEVRKEMELKQTRWKTYIPSVKWYGMNSQYHWWLLGDIFHLKKTERKGIIRGDFGISYADSQPIKDKIWEKVGISFTLSLFSILIAYLISIPIGIYSAYKKDSLADRGLSLILFILYSLPTFFVGTVLLLLFANPDFLVWFPESGIKDPTIWSNHPEWSDSVWDIFNWEKIKHQAPYLVLPLFTYTYGSFAFLSRIMRVGMIEIVSQDYIRTARAKGLSEKKVILKHALRNSLLPIVTVFAAIFPMSIGGSIIIEYIFTIPGMGTEMFNAILNYDYPMIIAFFTLIGFLTMVGYLVADLLYAVVDPRISYK